MTREQHTETLETYEEAIKSANSQRWKQAIEEKIEALEKNNTWKKIKRPPGTKTLTTKWVFQRKKAVTGETRFKARLVARGCGQIKGQDYNEVFSSVVKYDSIRYLLAIAATEGWTITQMDVTTAYLNSDLKEEIYLQPPEKISKDKNKTEVWKLNKAIYGLKQSGREWNEKLDRKL